MNKKLPVSAVLLVKNEEKNIEDCLKSIIWANEIIVLDDESTDATPQLCRTYTSTVIKRKMANEGEQRNHGYAMAKNQWILSIDADERVSEQLYLEIRDFLNNKELSNAYTALSIPVKTYIGNEWFRYGGWYPANKIRLFKKGFFYYSNQPIHPRAYFTGKALYVTGDLIHYGYRDIHHYIESNNRQTTLEVEKMIKAGKKFSTRTMIRKMISRFLKAYVMKQGYKGGFKGLFVSLFSAVYQFQSYAKYWEYLQNSKSQKKQV